MSSPGADLLGTVANAYVNRSFVPSPCRNTKTSMFSAMNRYVTYGVLTRSVLSSLMGNTI